MEHQPHAVAPECAAPDPDAIAEQLERLFAHPTFRSSRRSRDLLHYVVEHRGEGGDGHLKERALGVEVFGREPAYDTNTDPVVRVAAGEVRKRIAQYYHEAGHEDEIRIDLPVGSYVPEFHSPAAASRKTEPPPPAEEPPRAEVAPFPGMPEPVRAPRHDGRWWVYGVAGMGLIVMGLLAWRQFGVGRSPVPRAQARSAMDEFWRPVFTTSAPVQIGVGPWPGVGLLNPRQAQRLQFQSGAMRPIGWWDFIVASRVISLVQRNRRDYRIEDADSTDLNVLSQGPAVLIGANNNRWVMQLIRPLRFHFIQADGQYWIVDGQHPGKKYSSRAGSVPGGETQYAIVARLLEPTTGQYLVVLAGMGSPATVFAGMVATDPHQLQALADQLPKGWETKNIEALVSGQAVANEPGAPHVIAAEVW